MSSILCSVPSKHIKHEFVLRIKLLVLAIVVAVLAVSATFGQSVYNSSLNQNDLTSWQPYGSGCRVTIGADPGIIVADFDDSSDMA